MKIVIKEANADKINAAIKEAEGRATARTITAHDIITAAENITRRLDIPKKALIGVSAHVDPWAQDFPHAYKYTPESTHFDILFTPSGWTLTGVDRDSTNRASKGATVKLTENARAAILERVCTIHAANI